MKEVFKNAELVHLVLGYTFGFTLLFILAFLCFRIALGKVEEATSYGLVPLITCLSTLSGGFATWAFSGAKNIITSKPDNNHEPTN